MIFAASGLGKWVEEGGVLDKAVMESDESPFPGIVGFMIHGMRGMMIIALLLLISSCFAKIPGAVKWWRAWCSCSPWRNSPWAPTATPYRP
jgi:hypothetical protein